MHLVAVRTEFTPLHAISIACCAFECPELRREVVSNAVLATSALYTWNESITTTAPAIIGSLLLLK